MKEEIRNELKEKYFEPVDIHPERYNNLDEDGNGSANISGHYVYIIEGEIKTVLCHVGKHAGITCHHD